MIVPVLLLAFAFVVLMVAFLVIKDIWDGKTGTALAGIIAIVFIIFATTIIVGLIKLYSTNVLSILYSISKGAL